MSKIISIFGLNVPLWIILTAFFGVLYLSVTVLQNISDKRKKSKRNTLTDVQKSRN